MVRHFFWRPNPFVRGQWLGMETRQLSLRSAASERMTTEMHAGLIDTSNPRDLVTLTDRSTTTAV